MANSGKGYKRSWKNLLLDTNYQLVFTLFMVLSCALFMTGLGYLVMKEADTATTTAKNDISAQKEMNIVEEPVAKETMEHLDARRRLLDWILVGVGVALCLGLFVYGIKMTHKVAGPVFKIALYCDKVAKGKFDKLYNLRKGDQLVAFYDNFRQAHEVVRKIQERDVGTLKELIAAAERVELAGKSPELAAHLEVLKTLLKTKEATLA